MTRLDRPCLGYYDPTTNEWVRCGKPAQGGRCPEHKGLHEANRRPTAHRRGYDAQYFKDRAELLKPDPVTGELPRCQLRLPGCTTWATTADHVIPLDHGRNPDAKRGPLVPACKHCNSARGKRDLDRPAQARTPVAVDDDDGWFPPP